VNVDTRRIREIAASPEFRRGALDVLALAVGIALGVLSFFAVARASVPVGPAHLRVSANASLVPRTVVELPPFGRISARTHRGPTTIRIRLEEIDVPRTQRMIERGEISIPATLTAQTAAGLPSPGFEAALWRGLLGGLAVAGAAGALVALAFRRRRAIVVASVVLAMAIPGMAVGVAYATWDVTAFREPTLEGGLTYAPRLIDMFSDRVGSIERLQEQAVEVARDVAAYYADDRALSSGGPLSGTYRVVHVTDLHLDPVGAALASEVIRSYEASLVVDTGDLSIVGSPIESSAFASLVDTSVRRIFVPGNHDSPAAIAGLRRLGVTVVTSGTVDVDGFRIFGVPDPISRGFGVEPDGAVVAAAARTARAQLLESLRAGEPTPTIIAIHNPVMEREFIGLAPVLLSGHTHAARLYTNDGTARLNSGTLGGMPYDPAASGRRPRPYSASVLYFTADEPRRLVAIDRIAVFPNRSTTVTRDVFEETPLP